ncbi:hypothetical protein J6590_070244 [Homalodisca vitripennis]|nr:hypothetical protein J6590_070244 [Homalodisca vitripennis]
MSKLTQAGVYLPGIRAYGDTRVYKKGLSFRIVELSSGPLTTRIDENTVGRLSLMAQVHSPDMETLLGYDLD